MIVFVISFVITLQIWISAGHVTYIMTTKYLKFNSQLKDRKFKDFSGLFLFYFLFYNQNFVWGVLFTPGYNRVNSILGRHFDKQVSLRSLV